MVACSCWELKGKIDLCLEFTCPSSASLLCLACWQHKLIVINYVHVLEKHFSLGIWFMFRICIHPDLASPWLAHWLHLTHVVNDTHIVYCELNPSEGDIHLEFAIPNPSYPHDLLADDISLSDKLNTYVGSPHIVYCWFHVCWLLMKPVVVSCTSAHWWCFGYLAGIDDLHLYDEAWHYRPANEAITTLLYSPFQPSLTFASH